ncbi:dihydroorotate dehydrogenase [Paenibacillus sp. YAF4_2]
MSGVYGGGVNTVGFILVLFILLVIIVRSLCWF